MHQANPGVEGRDGGGAVVRANRRRARPLAGPPGWSNLDPRQALLDVEARVAPVVGSCRSVHHAGGLHHLVKSWKRVLWHGVVRDLLNEFPRPSPTPQARGEGQPRIAWRHDLAEVSLAGAVEEAEIDGDRAAAETQAVDEESERRRVAAGTACRPRSRSRRGSCRRTPSRGSAGVQRVGSEVVEEHVGEEARPERAGGL